MQIGAFLPWSWTKLRRERAGIRKLGWRDDRRVVEKPEDKHNDVDVGPGSLMFMGQNALTYFVV